VLFSVFFAIFRFFSIGPPGNFSADALASLQRLMGVRRQSFQSPEDLNSKIDKVTSLSPGRGNLANKRANCNCKLLGSTGTFIEEISNDILSYYEGAL